MAMPKSPPKKYLPLHRLARKLELDLLNQEEKIYLSALLKRLSDGELLEDILGIRKIRHRPNQSKTEQYVQEVYNLTQDSFNASGKKVNEAISSVANAHNVAFNSVSVAYYSKKGRDILRAIKDKN